MSRALRHWEQGPFELLLHAKEHYVAGNDHDRRIALIGYDESIEISITVYLSLHPIQRSGREHKKEDVEKWTRNYHTKLNFFYEGLNKRNIEAKIPKEDIVWFHDHRNEQYHDGIKGVPDGRTLEGIRTAAIWVFSTLFDIQEVEALLEDELRARKGHRRERLPKLDRALDGKFGLIEIGGNMYYTSEVLHAVDPNAYFELGNAIANTRKWNRESNEDFK